MNLGIKTGENYLRWAVDLSVAERAERTALLDRLPARMIDCHIHATKADAVGSLSPYAWAQVRSSFPVWSVSDSDELRDFLYGARTVTRFLMAHPYKGIDHRRSNAYLLNAATPDDRVILCGLPDDREYTVNQLRTGSYVGLKMYPHYREPPYEHLKEYFPGWALASAADAGVPAIVHLPLPLADCVEDVVRAARSHPGTKFVLAHLGRQHIVDDGASAAFDAAAARPNVAVDTSMATDQRVHELALAAFGPDRVIYGSDEPFNLLRYAAVQDPKLGYTLVSPRRYHWQTVSSFAPYERLARNAFLVHLQVIRALVGAVDAHCRDAAPAALQRIFHDNAVNWFFSRQADRAGDNSTPSP